MPQTQTHHINTGNRQLDIQLRRIARSVQTAMPAGNGISRTPQGTIGGFVRGRRRMPLTRSSGGGAGFTGNVWVPAASGGKRTLFVVSTGGLPHVHVNKLADPPVIETDEDVPGEWGPDELWYVKAEHSGSIIVP